MLRNLGVGRGIGMMGGIIHGIIDDHTGEAATGSILLPVQSNSSLKGTPLLLAHSEPLEKSKWEAQGRQKLQQALWWKSVQKLVDHS